MPKIEIKAGDLVRLYGTDNLAPESFVGYRWVGPRRSRAARQRWGVDGLHFFRPCCVCGAGAEGAKAGAWPMLLPNCC